MFTRQHYKEIAKILNKQINPITFVVSDCCIETAKNIVEQLTHYFKENNPNFDEKKFLKACGLEESDD